MRTITPSRASNRYSRTSSQRKHRPDYILVVLTVLLLVIGLVVVYSISPGLSAQRNVSENYFISKQAIAVVLGLITFGITAFVPMNVWKSLIKPLWIGAALVTIIALILPVTPEYPAHRWIRFGGLSLQAVEVIKFALLMWLAYFLAKKGKEGALKDTNKTFKPLLILLAIVGVVVAGLQSDLGSTGVIVAMIGAMAFVAGIPMKRLLMFAGIIALGTVLAISTSEYRRDRFMTFMQPERDCQSTGYQACQALIAVGSGGMFGKGLAHSVQAYGYLPEAANDSIFAIFAEKFGFVGAASLVMLFLAFFVRIKNVMERSPDLFSRFLVAGVLAWLSTQALINMGAMLGLLPLKGITLPFISYGGTSILFVTAIVGLVFNVSRYTTYGANTELSEGNEHEDTLNRRRVGRPYYATASRRA